MVQAENGIETNFFVQNKKKNDNVFVYRPFLTFYSNSTVGILNLRHKGPKSGYS